MADEQEFLYDVFLSHSSKDKAIVREVAERLKADGLSVWFDEWAIPAGGHIGHLIEQGLDQSRTLVLFLSKNAVGSEWATLERQSFQFEDPLNEKLRLQVIRLDDTKVPRALTPIKYLDWRTTPEASYELLLSACRPQLTRSSTSHVSHGSDRLIGAFKGHDRGVESVAWSPGGTRAISGGRDGAVRVWDIETGRSLGEFKGHRDWVRGVVWSPSGNHVLSGGKDGAVRVWDVESGSLAGEFEGHTDGVWSVAWSPDGGRALSGSEDGTIISWDAKTGQSLETGFSRDSVGRVEPGIRSVAWSPDGTRFLSGKRGGSIETWDAKTGLPLEVGMSPGGRESGVWSVAWSPDGTQFVSGNEGGSIGLWDVATQRLLNLLEGHSVRALSVAWSPDGTRLLSGGEEGTVRVWDAETGQSLYAFEGHEGWVRGVAWSPDGTRVLSGGADGIVRVWDASSLLSGTSVLTPASLETHYTNAKVLLVGDTSAGKTGLAHRLATGNWKPSDGSTVGAWATQWKLPVATEAGVEREIWMWDFGGQADQRLVHQLFLDRAAAVLLLFDAGDDDVLKGLRDWQVALRRTIPKDTPIFLIAGRIDAGFKASRGKIERFARTHGLRYVETSAMEGTGCDTLREALDEAIDWEDETKRTSPRLFRQIRDEILGLRADAQVLHTFKELRHRLVGRLSSDDASFEDDTLRTVIGLLDGPGAVKELQFGSYVLLQPDWVNAYAQAVLRTIRADEQELGSLPRRSIAEGELIYQSVGRDGEPHDMKRLPEAEERVVLGEMERALLTRGLCLPQGNRLVFPSHCGRERPDQPHDQRLPIVVSYKVEGFLDALYSTLVVKLTDGGAFSLKDLWRDAADFETLNKRKSLSIRLVRETASHGDISLRTGPGVTQDQLVVFANYIHDHLKEGADAVTRLRHYVCPHCGKPKGNPTVLREKLEIKGHGTTVECDFCEERISLWDDLEQRFADGDLREKVEGMKDTQRDRMDARRLGKLLALEVGARIASADQKSFEIPLNEDEGIDVELEFTDDDGHGTGQRLYLQLKAGNSHLRTRADGTEVFQIKKQRWIDYWLKQPFPVFLVAGTFENDDHRFGRRDKREFGHVRWMRIDDVLREKREAGAKRITQIEFVGERMDIKSIRRWRDEMLGDL